MTEVHDAHHSQTFLYLLHFCIHYPGFCFNLSPICLQLPLCLSTCWHFPIWACSRVTLSLYKWDAAGRFKAALALLTACLLHLSASWGGLTPVILVATVLSQFSVGRAHTAQPGKEGKRWQLPWPLRCIKVESSLNTHPEGASPPRETHICPSVCISY